MSTTARYNARKTAAVNSTRGTCVNHAIMEANPRPPGYAGIHRGDLGHRFAAPWGARGSPNAVQLYAILAAVGSPASR
jgi:hypothetical protein